MTELRVGIVGNAADKFTPRGREYAIQVIYDIIDDAMYRGLVPVIVSGDCHLGGVDIWAREIAVMKDLKLEAFPARVHKWDGAGGYKERNIMIAKTSDIVHCIVTRTYPKEYSGMKFKWCYHHKPPRDDHVKSGGCWTMKEAKRRGKEISLIIVDNGE